MLNQNQIQEIVRKQAQSKKNGASLLAIAGTALVMTACYGMTFTNNIDYVVVLIIGSLIAMIGIIGYKE